MYSWRLQRDDLTCESVTRLWSMKWSSCLLWTMLVWSSNIHGIAPCKLSTRYPLGRIRPLNEMRNQIVLYSYEKTLLICETKSKFSSLAFWAHITSIFFISLTGWRRPIFTHPDHCHCIPSFNDLNDDTTKWIIYNRCTCNLWWSSIEIFINLFQSNHFSPGTDNLYRVK